MAPPSFWSPSISLVKWQVGAPWKKRILWPHMSSVPLPMNWKHHTMVPTTLVSTLFPFTRSRNPVPLLVSLAFWPSGSTEDPVFVCVAHWSSGSRIASNIVMGSTFLWFQTYHSGPKFHTTRSTILLNFLEWHEFSRVTWDRSSYLLRYGTLYGMVPIEKVQAYVHSC